MLSLLSILLATQVPPRLQETIVVSAERLEQTWRETTAAVTVLGHDELSQLPAQTLGDALRLVPGLQIIAVNPGAPPMMSSRGFFGAGEVEYMQLLVDGVPVGDAESGLADWRSIPIDAIDHIEVLRGPGSSLFGDAAIGGVVQVFRRKQTSVKGTAGVPAGWSGDVSSPSLSLRATREEGFRDHSESRELFANAFFERGKLKTSLDVSDRKRDDPGPLSREQLDADRFGSDALYSGDEEHTRIARATLQYRGALDVLVHAQHRDSDRTRTLLLAPGFGDRATRELETFGGGANVTRTIERSRRRLAVGVDVSADALRSRYGTIDDVNDGRGSRRRGAAFFTGEWRVTRAVRLAGGARFDSIADSFEGTRVRDDAFSPRVGLAIDALGVTSYVQLARAFKAPTLDQRFDQRPLPDFQGGTFTISNPTLKAQRANNIEAGVRGASATRAWELVGYAMTVEDEIDFDVETFRYQNIGRSTHRGLESMVRWMPSDRRGLALTYTWTRAQSGGKQLKNIAEHLVRADANLRTLVDVHLSIEHSANRWLDDDNRIPLDDATVVDLRLAKTFAPFTLALDANNLFDARYAPLGFALGDTAFYYPAAGRSLALTLTWKGAAP